MSRRDADPTQSASAVQRELDALADALDRSVSLDDPEGTLLGYSVQGRDVDTARVEAILSRRVSDPVLAYQGSFGVEDATGPVRIPANPELQMGARTCLPIRRQRDTLALLWVLEDGRPLDPEETRLARTCGDRLRGLLGPAETADPVRLLTLLFTGDPPPDLRALVRDASPAGGRLWQFAVVASRAAAGTARRAVPRPARSNTVVETALVRGRRLVLAGRSLAAQSVAIRDLLPDYRSPRWVVGYSPAFDAATTEPDAVASLAASAIVAADCAATDPALPGTTGWLDLGLYRHLLLTTRPEEWPGPQPVPEHGRSADMLRHTLEVYLDHAGDAARSIGALQIHRTTFYYRLERLGRVYGIDLDNGLARTAYHLALKSRRLAAARDRCGWSAAFLDRLS